MRYLRFGLPLGIFVVILFFLFRGLWNDPRQLPSVLIDKPAPQFSLPILGSPDKKLTLDDMKGKVWLLNVWGSWCVSCQVEHPSLLAFQKMNVAPLIGFDWKDKPDAAMAWLARQGGDPYTMSVMDLDGRAAIDLGVYGAPETFIIDKAGVIRYKHTGPIDDKAITDKLLPVIRKLNQ